MGVTGTVQGIHAMIRQSPVLLIDRFQVTSGPSTGTMRLSLLVHRSMLFPVNARCSDMDWSRALPGDRL